MLPSHKNQIHYLEHTKIVKIDEKVAYTRDIKSKEFYQLSRNAPFFRTGM